MPSRIFISYRRDDAASDAGRLADHLSRRFGKDRIFLDVDTIQPGADFVQVLHTSLEQTAAVLVVIGPRWLSGAAPGGARRLDTPGDFVRLEVEAALGRTVPVVPVLVQGARMPRVEDLPPSLAALVTRQAVTLDYDEFHDDAERLCDRLAAEIGFTAPRRWSAVRRWWPVAALAAVVAIGLPYYAFTRDAAGRSTPRAAATEANAANDEAVNRLLATAAAQKRRNQDLEALDTLAKARTLAPGSTTVREAQEDVAMDWIRNVRVENGNSSFGEAIRPALDIVDAALPSATGRRRADLLAHTGWATFLLWRDGDRRLDPAIAYRDALAIDPENPFANAMLAHWTLFQNHDAVTEAARLFDIAVRSGRALDAIRVLQWAAYTNADSAPEAVAERLRVANAMRVGGEHLDMRQAQALWSPYYFALSPSHERERQALLDALPPADHIATLNWAFADYTAGDEARQKTIRYYMALLHARAGQTDEAATELRTLEQELVKSRSGGSLLDAVHAAVAATAAAKR
jgi:TIR domain-containing protein